MTDPDKSHGVETSCQRVLLSLAQLPEQERIGKGEIIKASNRLDCSDFSIRIKDGYPVIWKDERTRELDQTKTAMKYRIEIDQKRMSVQEKKIWVDCLQQLENGMTVHVQWEIVNIVSRGTRFAKIIALVPNHDQQQSTIQQDIRTVMRGGKRR